MAIVAYDGRRLSMLSSWTGSAPALKRAFNDAIGRPTHGLERVAELRSFETARRAPDGVFQPNRRDFFTRMDIEELSYARRLADQVAKSVGAAVSTLRGFASPPGRKVLLLLAGGWPFSPAEYVVNNPNRPVLEREVPTGEKLLSPLADTAN